MKTLLIAVLLATTSVTAGERYMHSCNNATPTPIYGFAVINASHVSVEFRKFYPGIRTRAALRDGVWYAKGMFRGTLVRCTFINGGEKPRYGRNNR